MTTTCRLAPAPVTALLTAVVTALAPAGPASAAPAPGADSVPVAQCIAARLPQGSQLFRAGDGSMRVVAIGRRGAIARWTITGAGASLHVARSGGAAGLDRAVTAACLPD
ncbi:MAG TPA: hypothetical protein VI199_02745 [Novosphingobium sp.]